MKTIAKLFMVVSSICFSNAQQEIANITGPCALAKCIHGTCRKFINEYFCWCDDGWTGINCESEIENINGLCSHAQCIHGVCRELDNEYLCWCDDGWTGINCESEIANINGPCAHAQCIHGTCRELTNEYLCWCADGWTGINCESEISKVHGSCAHAQCIHGVCQELENEYFCWCAEGWTGINCESVFTHLRGPCAHAKCEHGTCHVLNDDEYHCECEPGWTGKYCNEGTVSKCNHTCTLDAVILSSVVNSSHALQCKDSAFSSNEALIMTCCNLNNHNNWYQGIQVQPNNVCIDGEIDPYTPICEFNTTNTYDVIAGIFYGCIKNGTSGFMMIQQNCTTLPQLSYILEPEAMQYFVINHAYQ